MQPALLPLFPLQVVLLPGGLLPLHIFEERYKEMIGEVIQNQIEFGVVLANEKGIVNTGCTASVDRILRRYDDGRMDILARGRRRFEILLLNEERPFLRGTVDFFDDEQPEAAPEDLRRMAVDSFNQIQALSSSDPLNEADAENPQLSFRLAQSVPDLSFRQVLLAMRSEAERIRRLAEFLPGHLQKQRQIQRAKDLAPRNGHSRAKIP